MAINYGGRNGFDVEDEAGDATRGALKHVNRGNLKIIADDYYEEDLRLAA